MDIIIDRLDVSVWRKKNEDLIKDFTSKGNKAGHGGKVASFFVAISLGKRICYCKHYEKLSGKIFAEFIEYFFFMYTSFLFYWKYRRYFFTCLFYYFIFSVTHHTSQEMSYKYIFCL